MSAQTPRDFFQGTELSVGSNYNPAGLPTDADDVFLTTASGGLTLNASSLAMRSLNVGSNTAYTVSNNTAGAANSTLTISSISNPIGDLIFLGGATSSLFIQGANSGGGSGTLSLPLVSGNFNVAQPGATLSISAPIVPGPFGVVFTKIGAGTLNLSGNNSYRGTLNVNEGTVNLLPGGTLGLGLQAGLAVNNLNTNAGSTVTVNLFTSGSVRSLTGAVAVASSGANAATINLMGSGVELRLEAGAGGGGGGGTFAGVITGSGGVVQSRLSSLPEIFSGNNTYTGTTSIVQGPLLINGITSGQGNFLVQRTSSSFPPPILGGTGTIGLATNGLLTVSDGGRLEPGLMDSIGTLTLATSGTGGVVFGDNGIFAVQVGSAGASDLLAIAGGVIDLRSGSDALSISMLPGGFDGGPYTIALFAENLASGGFNSVTGLPSNYQVVYTPTSIMLVVIPEPAVCTLSVLGMFLLLGARRFTRQRS